MEKSHSRTFLNVTKSQSNLKVRENIAHMRVNTLRRRDVIPDMRDDKAWHALTTLLDGNSQVMTIL